MKNIEDDVQNYKMLYKKLTDILEEKTKIPKPVMQDLLKSDLFLDAKKCKRYGMIDEII
jgi:ATP-dependent protease ClpP protease subunit